MASSSTAVTKDHGKRVAIVTGAARGMYVFVTEKYVDHDNDVLMSLVEERP